MFTMGPPLRSQPTGGDPFAANVIALLHFNDAVNTSLPVVSLGSATRSNSDPTNSKVASSGQKFGAGGWSAVAGNGLKVTGTTGSSGFYTIEMFVKPATFTGLGRFFGALSSTGAHLFGLTFSGGTLKYLNQSTNEIPSSGTLTIGQWHHVAIGADMGGSGDARLWLDGVLVLTVGAGTSEDLSLDTYSLDIGHTTAVGGSTSSVMIDEFRWTHGVERYTANFAPPTAEFPNS